MAAECYMRGIDPTLATNTFRIVSVDMTVGGPKVEWTPKTNHWTVAEIRAVLKGAAETLSYAWVEGDEFPNRLTIQVKNQQKA